MAMYGVRQLLLIAGIPIPEGAVSYHTEVDSRRKREVVFVVQAKQGSAVIRQEISHDQWCRLYQQQRVGSLGWDIEPIH